jgi:hypothetical protein
VHGLASEGSSHLDQVPSQASNASCWLLRRAGKKERRARGRGWSWRKEEVVVVPCVVASVQVSSVLVHCRGIPALKPDQRPTTPTAPVTAIRLAIGPAASTGLGPGNHSGSVHPLEVYSWECGAAVVVCRQLKDTRSHKARTSRSEPRLTFWPWTGDLSSPRVATSYPLPVPPSPHVTATCRHHPPAIARNRLQIFQGRRRPTARPRRTHQLGIFLSRENGFLHVLILLTSDFGWI